MEVLRRRMRRDRPVQNLQRARGVAGAHPDQLGQFFMRVMIKRRAPQKIQKRLLRIIK